MRAISKADPFRRQASAIVFVIAICVAALFTKLLTLVDFAQPLHVMLLLTTALVFGTTSFGLISLGFYWRSWIESAAAVRRPGGPRA